MGIQKFCEVRGSMTTETFEGEEQEFKGDTEGQSELRRCVERRKLWKSSGEALENFWAGFLVGEGPSGSS